MPHTITYKGSILTDNDVAEIATDFKLSFALAADAFDQLRSKGTINLEKYAGTPRERLKQFIQSVVIDGNPQPVETPEPVVMSQPEEATVVEQNFDPQPLSERDEVIDHAATGLMRAFSDPNGCFIISEDGVCKINRNNPPSLKDSYQAVTHILKLKELGSVVDDKSSWMLGSAVSELEDLHGEDFNLSQVCEETDKNYNTTYQAVRVYKAFKNKRYGVSFTHHQEALMADIPITALRPDPVQTKKLILFKAESHKLSAKDVRALGSIAKSMEDDTVIQNIRTTQMAKDLIDAYAKTKVQYIVYDEGKMVRFTDTTGKLPAGKLVIDTKNWTARFDGGKAIEIKKVPNPLLNESE